MPPRRRLGRREPQEVHRITSARPGIRDDQAVRVRGYVTSMTIRIICFVLAVLADGWLTWVLLVGAVFIPYVAVVFANSGREPVQDPPDTFLDPTATRQLPGGP